MQFVSKATAAIGNGAQQVASAVASASGTLQTELNAAIADAGTGIASVSTQMSQLAAQIGQLSPPIQPQAMLGSLVPALAGMQADLGAVLASLAAVGPRLLAAGQELAKLDDVPSTLSVVTHLPARLAAAKPDVAAIPGRLAGLALTARGLTDRVLALQPRLRDLAGPLARGETPAALAAVNAEIAALRQQGTDGAAEIRAGLDGLSQDIGHALDG
ncbi:MAG TPA: hypothetical protein VNS31_14250, partial [Ramlibacter sp.]|nr:hypothetical protein [Ramlibacter sp.]